MRVGVIGAMDEEIIFFKEKLEKRTDFVICGYDFFEGKIDNKDLVVLKSGIGKVNAAMSTTLLHSHYKCDYIINIGSAGGFDDSFNIGDIILSTELRSHDVDVTAFGYEFGQVPKMPAFFQSCETLVKIAEECSEHIAPHRILKGLIVSGDSFMNKIEQINLIKSRFNNILAAEMEACAIAQVCYQFNVPFIIIRALSDVVGAEAPADHMTYLELASKNSTKLALSMLQRLE